MRQVGLLILLVAVAAGCGERRKPISRRGDLGPSVVVIDPRVPEKPKAAPALPLVDEQEPDDDLAHAQPMEAGKGIRGTIREPLAPVKSGRKETRAVGDEDYYSFVDVGDGARSDAGISFRVARIELEGVPGLDLGLEALDGDGKRLWAANDNAEGKGEVIPNLVVEPGRTYYVKVRSLTAKAGTQPYSLTVVTSPSSAGEEREPNDDAAHATNIAGSDATGYYGKKRDEDWLRFTTNAAAGSTLRLELSGVEGVAPELRMLSATGVLIVDARGGRGEELRLRNVGIPAGPLTLTVRAAEGRNTELRWLLKSTVEGALDGAEKEPNETVAAATPLDANIGRVSGFLWPADVDVYKITGVPAGSLVSASVDGVPRVDLRLERLASDGRVLMRADEAGSDRGETLPPLPGNDLYLRVSARARDVAFDAPYTLTVTVMPGAEDLELEPNDTMATATPWAANAPSMRGYLAPRGDEDWYRIQAPGTAAKLTVETTTPAGISVNVRVVDESKAPLGPSLSGGRAAGPVQPGKSYWISIKANTDKLSNPRDPYTVTAKFE